MSLAVVILAAGKGTRMKSSLPKVLHQLAGQPMLSHVVAAARQVEPGSITIVYGHEGERVKATIEGSDIQWAEQAQQLGTGHAVAQALPQISEDVVLVLYGDVPLIQPQTLQRCLQQTHSQQLCLITLNMGNPAGYGRILRNAGEQIIGIVEQKDATAEQLSINEVNTGILACPREFLAEVLPTLSCSNAQGEYYLTDVIAKAVTAGLAVTHVQPQEPWEVDGVNDRMQMARLERIYQRQLAQQLMRDGVALADPARIDIRGQLHTESDVWIDINCLFEGEVRLGRGVTIGPNCVIRHAVIGADSVIEANSVIDGAQVAAQCHIGPFARLRPGAELATGAKAGNFVEIKKSRIGEGSKVNHLTYIGDAEVGANVNIGAGTITCNYDGVNKWPTTIGDGAFIGSNTALVAPVTVGANATVGAGSTIAKAVPANQLGVARGKQRNIDHWQRPVKQEK